MTEGEFWDEVEGAAEFDYPIPPEHRARLLRDAGFAAALASYTHRASESERDEALAEAVRLARLVGDVRGVEGEQARQGTLDVEAPPWWEAHSRRVFEDYRSAQRVLLATLGRSEPLPVASLGTFLAEKRARESEQGDRGLFLYYPTGRERPPYTYIETYRGYSLKEYRDEFWVAHFNPDEHERARRDWIEARLQPLARVVMTQDDIAAVTGCEKWQVTGFLLCDVVPLLPWIHIRTPGRARGSEVVRIVIGSPRVPPSHVRDAYVAFRQREGAHALGQPQPSRSEWPKRAEAFVLEYRAKLGGRRFLWSECFAAFAARYPNQPYANHASFKSKFYSPKSRARRTGSQPL